MKNNVKELYRLSVVKYMTHVYHNYCEISSKPEKDDEYSQLRPKSLIDGCKFNEFSDSEDSFVKNIKNEFAILRRINKLIVIEKTEDKISIKCFNREYYKEAGKVYFKDKRILSFVTYNFKTNDLYDGFLEGYHKKRKSKKVLRRNQFWRQPINNISSVIRNILTDSKLNPGDFVLETYKIIDIFIDNIPNTEKNFLYSPDDILFKTRANVIGSKLPDNWQVFSKTYPTLTKKELKKHDYKFIDTLLTHYKISGGKFKKIFHELEYINGNILRFAIDYFGSDFLRNQKTENIKQILNYRDDHSLDSFIDLLEIVKLTDFEKNNFWSLLCDHINLTSLIEHINFIRNLRNFGETVTLKSNCESKFILEHVELSELLQSYKKGTSYRFYNEDFVKRVEKPIFNSVYYYPVLLTSTEEYNDESVNQSNCVRGYIDKSSSLIISLRKGDVNSKDRATIEYRIQKMGNKFIINNIQCLGRFNKRLSDEWNYAVRNLDSRISVLGTSNVFTLPEMVTKFKLKETYHKAVSTEKGNIIWDTDKNNNTIDIF